MPVLARRNHISLVPPLQLPQAHAADAGYIAAVESLLFGLLRNHPALPRFQHFSPLPFLCEISANLDCTYAISQVNGMPGSTRGLREEITTEPGVRCARADGRLRGLCRFGSRTAMDRA